jgi:hypothetical protein
MQHVFVMEPEALDELMIANPRRFFEPLRG